MTSAFILKGPLDILIGFTIKEQTLRLKHIYLVRKIMQNYLLLEQNGPRRTTFRNGALQLLSDTIIILSNAQCNGNRKPIICKLQLLQLFVENIFFFGKRPPTFSKIFPPTPLKLTVCFYFKIEILVTLPNLNSCSLKSFCLVRLRLKLLGMFFKCRSF